ncbi:MAG TPA: hypothetical protein VFW44_08325 [Bryobacteraceae bacterium]|nr:hypothetical protein [Bryobacteraceae bacterium]
MIVELKTTALDIGIPNVSQAEMLLIFGMAITMSMIPYFFLYRSLREKPAGAPVRKHSALVERLAALFHAHRHPVLHH